MRRAHLVLAILAFLWSLGLLIVSSDVGGGDFVLGLGLGLMALLLIVVWLIQVGIALNGWFRRRSERPELRLVLALLACEAIFFAGASCLAAMETPFRVRFQLSRSALTEVATGRVSSQRAGLFFIRSIERDGGVVRLESGDWFMSRGGFAYSPDGAPKEAPGFSYWRIEGPWYRWSQG